MFPLLREHEIYFDEDKPLLCAVFCIENDESVNGLESRQFGGVLQVMLLRENDSEVVALEETDDRNEFNEEL